ncbi:MAG: Ltp family lipoprotein [Candidatus Dormibacteraeota bacterium]|nr:Ltp family lipoprotein [Candidatus Dormibacteraeota bacterium]
MTPQQQNAAQAAQQYLSIQGFSRQGLIDQLSSSAGDGYSVPDATVAVDSLNVDWNAEAVQAAKSYLAMQPFSCNGLIQQLDSSAGDQFTVAQATYGAQHSGAC